MSALPTLHLGVPLLSEFTLRTTAQIVAWVELANAASKHQGPPGPYSAWFDPSDQTLSALEAKFPGVPRDEDQFETFFYRLLDLAHFAQETRVANYTAAQVATFVATHLAEATTTGASALDSHVSVAERLASAFGFLQRSPIGPALLKADSAAIYPVTLSTTAIAVYAASLPYFPPAWVLSFEACLDDDLQPRLTLSALVAYVSTNILPLPPAHYAGLMAIYERQLLEAKHESELKALHARLRGLRTTDPAAARVPKDRAARERQPHAARPGLQPPLTAAEVAEAVQLLAAGSCLGCKEPFAPGHVCPAVGRRQAVRAEVRSLRTANQWPPARAPAVAPPAVALPALMDAPPAQARQGWPVIPPTARAPAFQVQGAVVPAAAPRV